MNIEFLIKYGYRTNKIFGKEIQELIYFPYYFVKEEIPNFIESNNFVELVFRLLGKKVSRKKIQRKKLKELMPIVLWTIDQMKSIQELEENTLETPPDIDYISAGIERLNEFRSFNVIDVLAGGDILKWDEVSELPYHKVWLKMRMQKTKDEIRRKYDQIQRDKQKNKLK